MAHSVPSYSLGGARTQPSQESMAELGEGAPEEKPRNYNEPWTASVFHRRHTWPYFP